MRTTTKFLTTLVMAGAVLSGTAALSAGPAGALPCADCDPGGGGGDGGGVPVPPPPSVPAITAYERTDFGNTGLHMETWARVSRNVGLVTGEPTHTWNSWWGVGYHGSVAVELLDQNGDVIAITNPQTYGVDARAVFWTLSDRRDFWSQSFDPVVTQRATSVKILHTSATRDNFLNDVRAIRDRACVIWGVVRPGQACPLGPVA
jgi:hypothetical protein